MVSCAVALSGRHSAELSALVTHTRPDCTALIAADAVAVTVAEPWPPGGLLAALLPAERGCHR